MLAALLAVGASAGPPEQVQHADYLYALGETFTSICRRPGSTQRSPSISFRVHECSFDSAEAPAPRVAQTRSSRRSRIPTVER
ncbi:MAG: hypothetical protein ABIO51_00870 [Solirubrobacteraceae bacterium]